MSPKLIETILELPLKKGFRRCLIKHENDRLVSVYYVTPDNKYLKNVSEVCDWIENEKQDQVFSRKHFNFVAKKLTAHEGEFIIDYDSVPVDIKDSVIIRKKSVAPIIKTIENDEIVSGKTDFTLDSISEIPLKRAKMDEVPILEEVVDMEQVGGINNEYLSMTSQEIVSTRHNPEVLESVSTAEKSGTNDMPWGECLQTQHCTTEYESKNITQIDTLSLKKSVENNIATQEPLPSNHLETEAESLKTVSPNTICNNGSLLDLCPNDLAHINNEEMSNTLSADTISNPSVTCNELKTRDYSYEYPLSIGNMNRVVETNRNCHIDRILEALDGDAESELIEFIRPYCGNHCAFDSKGNPRVAFECDICLILWHNDCIGYRCATIGVVSLLICDNCFLIQESLSIELPNIFCDVDKLLHCEFKTEPKVNGRTVAIPAKLESIFKLCKVHWALQNKNKPKSRLIGPRPNAIKEKDIAFVEGYRYFLNIFINSDNIVHGLQQDFIRLAYSMKDVDKMSHIFADKVSEMLLNGKVFPLCTMRVTVSHDGIITIPLTTKVSKPGYALFYTREFGQDSDSAYIRRYESLKSAMCSNYQSDEVRQSVLPLPELQKEKSKEKPNEKSTEPQRQILIKTGCPSKIVNVAKHTPGPLSKQLASIPARGLTLTSSSFKSTISSNNLPNNLIPISKDQLQSFSKMIQIEKQSKNVLNDKRSIMLHNSSMIQYYHLADLPFTILEKIMSTRNLSTVDKLNCRLVNRVLKSVVDGGRVLHKIIVNPSVVTGLLKMFDFFTKQYVKKVTFNIDFQQPFDLEFFNSFLSRLKLYPDSFHLESISLKLTGLIHLKSKFQLSIQDIFSTNKSLKSLSVSSDQRIVILLGSSSCLRSDSLETLKLKNIENIPDILQSKHDFTPKLKNLHCGNCSRLQTLTTVYGPVISLNYITSLRMDFGDYVNFNNVTIFSMLTGLERLVISRPRINETLKKLLLHILIHKSLKVFRLDIELATKEQLLSCTQFGCYFPPYIGRISWNIYCSSQFMKSQAAFVKRISECMPVNVSTILRIL